MPPVPLPSRAYIRASSLGSGSYGEVVVVYDAEEGSEWAAKRFEVDEEDGSLTEGALVELSVLVLCQGVPSLAVAQLQDVCSLPVEMDMKSKAELREEYGSDSGISAGGEALEDLCAVMPRYTCSLSSAITGRALTGGKSKLEVALGLLKALVVLHGSGLMHRDIKSDNVMLDQALRPVLIDFSLSKFHEDGREMFKGRGMGEGGAKAHTGKLGTPTYTAPEVYRGEPYGPSADAWSLGVVLLELFTSELLTVDRDKAAFAKIAEMRSKMSSSKPVPRVLVGLLTEKAGERMTCLEALKELG
jgi:serine/threonine protein kinase